LFIILLCFFFKLNQPETCPQYCVQMFVQKFAFVSPFGQIATHSSLVIALILFVED